MSDPSGLHVLTQPTNRKFLWGLSVAKCHTFFRFLESGINCGTQPTDYTTRKKVSHLSCLSPLSHFSLLSLYLVG